MKEECLLCGAPLEYLTRGRKMECALCHKKERSKTRCIKGHFICNQCHTKGIDQVLTLCLETTSANPVEILDHLMAQPFCQMHGPEHHILVGASLLTAYRNAGGEIDLAPALVELQRRGQHVPGGVCGFWGACGAGISTGMSLSILSNATPLSKEPLGLSNQMTARALDAIGTIGGPRCCKRNSYLSLLAAAAFVEERFHLSMPVPAIRCAYAGQNNQCLGKVCPFSPGS